MADENNNGIAFQLGQLVAGVDALNKRFDAFDKVHDTVEKRLKVLEDTQSFWKGQVILIGALVSLLASTALNFLSKKLGLV